MSGILNRYRSLVGEGLSRTLVRGATGYAGARVLGKGLGFGLQLLLTNLLGAEGYGLYVYPLAWMSLLILVAVVGLDTTIVRYLPNYLTSEEPAKAKGLLLAGGRRVLVASLLTAGLVAAVVWLLRARLPPGLAPVFWSMSLLLVARALLTLYSAALRGLKRVLQSELCMSAVVPAVLGVTVAGIYFLAPRALDATTVMLAHAGVTCLAIVVVATLLCRALPRDVLDASANLTDRQKWHSVGWALLLVSASHLLLAKADVLMVGALVGTTGAGIYEIAARLAEGVGFGLQAVNSIAAPMISELYEKGDTEDLQDLLTLGARGVLLIAVPAVVVLSFWGQSILGLFGDEFTTGYSVLLMLTLGQFVHALAGSVGFVMIMTDHHRESAAIIGSSAVINVLLNFWFIQLWGLEGAAFATAATTVLWNALLLRFVWVNLSLNTTAFRLGVAGR